MLNYIVSYRKSFVLLCRSATQNAEMCNLYIMFYAESASLVHPSQLTCSGVDQPDLLSSMPSDSDVRLPSRPDLDADTDDISDHHRHPAGARTCHFNKYVAPLYDTIRYETIGEFKMDSKAKYSA